MARGIVYFKKVDMFLTWSTVTDSPVTYLMTEKEYRAYYAIEYGKVGNPELYNQPGRFELDDKLDEARNTGVNWAGHTLEDVLSCNRAGQNEVEATEDEIIKAYMVAK